MSQPPHPQRSSPTQSSYGSLPWYGTPASYEAPSSYGRQPAYPPQAGYRPQPYDPTGQPRSSPGGAPPKKSSTRLIPLVVAGLLVVAGIGVALWFGLRSDGAGPGDIPTATQQPTGLGSDPTMDGFAEDCFAGEMQACDDLFLQSPAGSTYETYGGTCAGRQPDAAFDTVFCVDAFTG